MKLGYIHPQKGVLVEIKTDGYAVFSRIQWIYLALKLRKKIIEYRKNETF